MSGSVTQEQLLIQDGSGSLTTPGMPRNKAQIALVVNGNIVLDTNGKPVLIEQVFDAAVLAAVQSVGAQLGGTLEVSFESGTVSISSGTIVSRAPQNLTMTFINVAANASVLAIAANPNRKSLQIMNLGLGQATAKPFAAAGTGGTPPTAPGQPSATSNVVLPGQAYPLQPASVAGQQGGSTPIYDGAGVSVDEWDVATGATGTSILVIEGN